MNPPAKLSPAPVGSKTAGSGYADAAKTSSPEKKSAPYSPRFTTTARGPNERIRRAAFTTLCSSASWRASASFTKRRSTRFSVRSRLSRFEVIQKFIVSHATKRGARTWSSTVRCRSGSMLPRNTYSESRIVGGQLRAELGEHVELRVERVRGVEVELVAALPAEGPPGPADEPGEVDRRASAKKRDVLLREVLADDRDHAGRAEEARADREVGGRAAEHVVAPPERRLEGVERDGSDGEQRHAGLSGRGAPRRGAFASAALGELVNRQRGLRPSGAASPPRIARAALGRELSARGRDVAPAVLADDHGEVPRRERLLERDHPLAAPARRRAARGSRCTG